MRYKGITGCKLRLLGEAGRSRDERRAERRVRERGAMKEGKGTEPTAVGF